MRQLFLNRADPSSIGLSAIGGVFRSIGPEDRSGLSLGLGGKGRPVFAPVAPGTILEVKIEECSLLQLGQAIPVTCSPSVLALDGEREIDVRGGDAFAVRLAQNGPMVMDVQRTMQAAMKKSVLAPDMTDACFCINREKASSRIG